MFIKGNMIYVQNPHNRLTNFSSGTGRAVRLFLTALIIQVFAISLSAQPQSSQSMEVQVTQLEQNYDSHISNMLGNYFDRDAYIVNVRVNAEMRDETTSRTTDQVIREPRGNVSMPGLPYIPEENIRPEQRIQTETTIRESTVRSLNLLNLNIDILADTSFTDQQVEFMELLTNIAAKTNPQRGDQVTVSRIPIPGYNMEIIPEEPEQIEETDILAHINQYLPGIFLLLIGLLYLANRFQNVAATKSPKRKSREEYKRETLEFDQPAQSTPSSGKPEPKPEESSLSDKLDDVLKQFIKAPRDVALLFEYWIDDNPEDGTERAAKVIQTIDKELLESLSQELPEREFMMIRTKLNSLPSMKNAEREKVADNFLRIFNTRIGSSDRKTKYGQLNLFRYLGHMSDHQVEMLIEQIPPQSAAVTLDYMEPERAANILENMTSERAAEVMLQIVNVPSLNYKEYNKISSDLFSKAIHLLKVEKQKRQGLDHMLPILQELPLKDQQRFIDQMDLMGSSVGRTIKSSVIMPEQIPQLHDAIVQSAVERLDTQTLVHALYDFDEHTLEKILKFRPNREQRLIRRELSRNEYLDSKRVKRAQLQLMDFIRRSADELQS